MLQVTLALCLIGAVKWVRGLLVFISQIVGGICAAGIVQCLFPAAMNVSTTLGGGTSIVRGLFIEMFLTAMLVFTICMLAAEKHKGTFLAPIGIGLALFICELTGMLLIAISPLHCANICRRLLHRRLIEPRSFLWSLRNSPFFPRIPLDLLVGTFPRIAPRCRLLPSYQDFGIRDSQPRPGLQRQGSRGL